MSEIQKDIKTDLQKILPIWAGILILSLIGVYLIKSADLKIINYLEYPEMNVSKIANSYLLEGERYWLKCADKIDNLRKAGKPIILPKDDPDYVKAIELFDKSLQYTEIPQVYRFLADLALFVDDKPQQNFYQGMNVYSDKKTISEAKEYFLAATNYDKKFLPAIEKLAMINLDSANFTEAEKFIQEYEQHNKDSAVALFLRGRFVLLNKKTDDAIELFKFSSAKNPKYVDNYIYLANCYESKGMTDDVCKVLKKLNEISPNHPTYLHKLGIAYLKAGKPDSAKEPLLKALELYPSHPMLNFDLARAYNKMGKGYYASYYLKKAIDLDPSLKNSILQ